MNYIKFLKITIHQLIIFRKQRFLNFPILLKGNGKSKEDKVDKFSENGQFKNRYFPNTYLFSNLKSQRVINKIYKNQSILIENLADF